MDQIGIKKAVQIAFLEVQTLFEKEHYMDLGLEETELTDNDEYWLITVGYNIKNPNRTDSPIDLVTGSGSLDPLIRKYKTFKIEAKTGKVRSMKIREI